MSFDSKGWEKFSALCLPGFASCDFREELVAVCGGHEDIASVVYHHLGARSLEWMNRKVPALNNKVPRSRVHGEATELKQVLWSFPG